MQGESGENAQTNVSHSTTLSLSQTRERTRTHTHIHKHSHARAHTQGSSPLLSSGPYGKIVHGFNRNTNERTTRRARKESREERMRIVDRTLTVPPPRVEALMMACSRG